MLLLPMVIGCSGARCDDPILIEPQIEYRLSAGEEITISSIDFFDSEADCPPPEVEFDLTWVAPCIAPGALYATSDGGRIQTTASEVFLDYSTTRGQYPAYLQDTATVGEESSDITVFVEFEVESVDMDSVPIPAMDQVGMDAVVGDLVTLSATTSEVPTTAGQVFYRWQHVLSTAHPDQMTSIPYYSFVPTEARNYVVSVSISTCFQYAGATSPSQASWVRVTDD